MIKHIKKIYPVLVLALAFSCTFEGTNDPAEVTVEKPHDPIPADGAVGISTAVTLRWSSAGTETYDIWFDTSNPPVNKLASDTTAGSVTVTGLDSSTEYYWKVTGKTGGNSYEGDIWSFTTEGTSTANPGYVMLKYNIETKEPSYVNVLFQVLDLDGEGANELTEEDFVIYEDNMLISPSESAAKIRKKEDITYTLRTVLMIDNSASLQGSMEELRAAASTFVTGMDENQEIALYKFSDEPELILDFTSDMVKLVNAIQSIDVGFNTTNLYGAVIEGASRLEEEFTTDKSVQSALVLFTDGRDTQGKYTFNRALSSVEGKTSFTVGLGSEIEPDVLAALGTRDFYPVEDVNELSDKFAEIQIRLKQYSESYYILDYLSPKRGDNDHTLQVHIKDNPWAGAKSILTGEFNSAGFYSVKPGLYINPDKDNPEGISTLSLDRGESVTVEAASYLVDNIPSYTWESGDTTAVKIAAAGEYNSTATITAAGASGKQVTVVVLDFNNDLSKLLTVIIK